MSDDPNYEVTEVSVSAGRKRQLDQYEPINEQVTLTAEVPEGEDSEAVAKELEDMAWDLAERGVMER